MKKTFDLLFKKFMRATKKTSKKTELKKYVLSLEMNFFRMIFYLPKWTVFFGNWQENNARAEQKKTHVFLVMRGLNLMRALM